MTRKPNTEVVTDEEAIASEPQTIGAGFKILPIDAYVIKAGDQAPAPEVTRVKIVKRFILNRDNHTTFLFDPKSTNCNEEGYYDVSPEDAVHPYLLAHTDNPPPVAHQPGTLKFAEEQQRKIRQDRIQEAIDKQHLNESIAEAKRQNLVGLRNRLGGDNSGLEDVNI